MDNPAAIAPSDTEQAETTDPSAPARNLAIAIAREAQLDLPAQPELYISDIHGEYEAFAQVLRSGCGELQELIRTTFGTSLTDAQKEALATLVMYPREKTASVRQSLATGSCPVGAATIADWSKKAIVKMSTLLHTLATVRSVREVRDAMPKAWAPVIKELLAAADRPNPSGGSEAAGTGSFATLIAQKVVDAQAADDLICALSETIEKLLVGHLHMLGDVFDRGPAPDAVLDELMAFHDVDVQWGNHDIVWMGAALGQAGCIAHVVRNCARYANLDVLEDAYGISLDALKEFARTAYADDPCAGFALKGGHDKYPELSDEEYDLNVKVQKTMAIIEFKVEKRYSDAYPSFGLDNRNLLGTIDREHGTVVVDGIEYPLTDTVLPTVDPSAPYTLTAGEQKVVESLQEAFVGCEKLQRHIRFLLDRGSLYRIVGNKLLFHACVPLNPDGSLKEVELFGKTYKGRALFDAVEQGVRKAFSATDPAERERGRDLLWYLWLGEGSPLFAKSKMATFEIYFIADKAARKEVKNPFYTLIEDERVLAGIFEDFGMDPAASRIVCGHVPVKVKDGEDPVKCGGKALMIDGGFSRAYQKSTGIAGFALVDDANGLVLNTLGPLSSHTDAVEDDAFIDIEPRVLERYDEPRTVADTEKGARVRAEADEFRKAAVADSAPEAAGER